MKGHVDIILHDVNTGAEKHIEKDNMVTNAVKQFMSSHLTWGGSRSSFNPLATTLLGGLRIWDDILTESVNNFHFPSEAHLVGWGNRSTNTSDTMMGSINSLESGATATGYKTTWDFTTSQCNGTIGSVSLGNVVDPFRIGRAYNSGYDYLVYTSLFRPLTDAVTWTILSSLYPIFYNGDYAYLSRFGVSNSMGIYKLECGSLSTIKSGHVYSNTHSWELDTTIDLSDYSFGDPGRPYNGNDGYMYISTVTSSDTFKYLKIKISDLSYDIESTTVTCSGCSFTTGVNDITIFGNLYAAIRKSDGTGAYIVNLSNTSDVELVEFSLSSGIIGKACGMVNDVLKIQNSGILYADGVFVAKSSSSTVDYPSSWAMLVDKTTLLTMYRPNTAYSGGTGKDSLSFDLCTDYIGTICNLSSPVTKTSAQTMKIVYTLTDA